MRFLSFYNFALISILSISGLANAQTNSQRLMSLFFIPVALYFGVQAFNKRRRTSTKTPSHPQSLTPTITQSLGRSSTQVLEPEMLTDQEVSDVNRRLFLKLIGSAGLATFTFSLFTKRAHAAFFGSVPGPGTVAIKNTSGDPIDPAEKEPTDGYEVNDVDDAAIPAYYGFLDKDGRWYITREDSSGGYRYVRGSSSYSSNWTTRATLSYDYFDSVF